MNPYSGQPGAFPVQPGAVKTLEVLLYRRICPVCVDRNVDGSCSLEEQGECFLFARFPKIVQAVSQTRSDKIDDYIAAIRENVCADCVNQDTDGLCKAREEVRGALDRYLLLIVASLEEVRGVTLT